MIHGPQIAERPTVYDAAGAKVGTVRGYDPQAGYLAVEKGWLFPKDVYIPVSAVQSIDANGDLHLTVSQDDLQADQYGSSPTNVATTPTGYDHGVGTADTVAMTAVATDTTTRGQSQSVQANEEIAVPMREEELVVGTREPEEGHVHLHKDVVTQQQTVSVPLERERVTVERVPVTGQADVATANAFQERDIDVPVMGEEAVVAKRARAVEEVRLHKDTVAEQQQVTDTVRKERVTIDPPHADVDTLPNPTTIKPRR